MDDMSGKGWTAFGSPGTGSGQFNKPYCLTIDKKDRIVISDSHGGRIVRMDDMDGSGWTCFAFR